MDSTSVSLLRRLRQPDQDAAWQRFVDLYAPLIYHWGRTHGLNTTDASDLVQEVLTTLVSKLREFEYDPEQSFRGWLRTVTVNKTRDMQRRQAARPATGVAETIELASGTNNVDLLEATEYRNFIVQRALKLMQAEFQEQTWQACWLHVTEGRRAADVARELGITANAVHIAKCRVLRRLREELDGLME
jgi:RNA polymerase sigma-70 factor (ECF subfamily)